METYAIYPVTPDRWDDLVELFERKGPRGGRPMPGTCWCAGWREEQGQRQLRKAAMKACVDGRRTPGMIAYAAGRPVGWVAVAPHALTSWRAEENASWMGRRESFAARGFVTIRDSGKRALMRLSFQPEP